MPTVTDLSGVFSEGQTLTIQGSGFGVKSPAKPYIWCPGDTTINPNTTLGRYGWYLIQGPVTWQASGGPDGDDGCILLDDAMVIARGSVDKDWWAINSQHSWWHWRLRVNSLAFGGNLKIMRLRPIGLPEDGDVILSTNGTYGHIGVEGGSGIGHINSPLIPDTNWHVFEWRMLGQSAYNVADANFWVTRDKSTYGVDLLGALIRGSGTAGMEAVLGEYHLKNEVFGTAVQYCKDFYVDDSWARVLVMNTANPATATRVCPLIPQTWSDTQITAVVNHPSGLFGPTESVFLYVYDDNNAYGTYPAQYGAIYGGDPPPAVPGAPTILSTLWV